MMNIKKYIVHILAFSLIILSLILSVILFIRQNKGTLRSFVFPSADSGRYVVEYRKISDELNQSEIQTYISDLLLGAGTERTKMLFTPGTKVESCFIRNNVLYLNLSDDLIKMGNDVADIEEGVILLKKNIRMNFRNIKKIELFIGNKYAYENL